MLKILLKTSLLILLFVSFTQADEFSKSEINKVLKETYNKFKGDVGGKNADYIKALAQVDPKTFGITLVDAKGNIY